MKDIRDFKDIHKKKDIYVLASGKSVDFIDPSFFDNKIVIGINQAYKKTPCQYLVRKENALLDDVLQKNPASIIFISKGDKGQLDSNNLQSCERSPFCDRTVVFNHLKNENTTVVFPQEEDCLIVSYSTITSGIHLAAYMGAKNIILIGHDCGTLDNEVNFTDYHSKESYEICHKQGATDYEKWLTKIETQTIQIKKILQDKYGCNIYSLNPFINFGLEGHVYKNSCDSKVEKPKPTPKPKPKAKPKAKPKEKPNNKQLLKKNKPLNNRIMSFTSTSQKR